MDSLTYEAGIDAANNGDTVLVDTGTYVENINFNGKNIVVGSFFLITEDTSYIAQTVIDGNNYYMVVTFDSGEGSSAVLTGFTITNGQGGGSHPDYIGGGVTCNNSNPSLRNLTISDNITTWGAGGGIQCKNSAMSLVNVVVRGNTANYGGGIHCYNSNISLENVIVTGNEATEGGGIVCRDNSNPKLMNVTMSKNTASFGSGIYCLSYSNPSLVNTILWNDPPQEIYFDQEFGSNSITISYSDIQGGEEEIVTNDNGTINWLEGNIDADPLFVDANNSDFHLQEGSPCIDAGTPFFVWEGDTLINLSPHEYFGFAPDMGAFEAPAPVIGPELSIFPAEGFALVLHEENPETAVTFAIYNNGEDTVSYNLHVESADSTYILYTDEPDTTTFNGNIWMMRPDGSEKTQLTFEMLDREPVWSPDGEKIAFWSYRSGNADVWVMNADGTELINLTNHDAGDRYPHWSPNGQHIIFASNRDELTEIYVMTSIGEDVQRLTFNDWFDFRPRYSPDGLHFVTSSRVPGGDPDVYVYTSDGESYINIGVPGVIDFQPPWTPDSKRVVWVSGDPFQGELDIVSSSMDGSDFRLEYGTAENDYYPRYSPDGQFLAFSKSTFYPRGGDEIFVWHKSMNRLTQITDNTPVTREWGPEWSPFLNSPGWITVDVDSSQISPGGSHSITLTINASNVPLGEHTTSVMIIEATTGNLLVAVPVNIRTTDTYGAEIQEIVDVPDDQGSYVHIHFLRSFYDTDSLSRSRDTEFYTLWRRLEDGSWEGLRSIGAYGQHGYTILGETFQDATDSLYQETEFRITAHMNEGNFASESAWGVSWDNIAPGIPGGFNLTTGMDFIEISWEPSSDEDFQFFRVYRVTDPDFDPTEAELMSETVEAFYAEYGIESGEYFYVVTAVDYHWNESGFSEVVEATVSIVDGSQLPGEYSLSQNYPNPFNPVTTLRYDLPERAEVVLTVYDILGREVKTLVRGVQEPGFKSVIWNGTNDAGRPMSAGIYLYRVQAGDFVQVKKMVLLK